MFYLAKSNPTSSTLNKNVHAKILTSNYVHHAITFCHSLIVLCSVYCENNAALMIKCQHKTTKLNTGCSHYLLIKDLQYKGPLLISILSGQTMATFVYSLVIHIDWLRTLAARVAGQIYTNTFTISSLNIQSGINKIMNFDTPSLFVNEISFRFNTFYYTYQF